MNGAYVLKPAFFCSHVMVTLYLPTGGSVTFAILAGESYDAWICASRRLHHFRSLFSLSGNERTKKSGVIGAQLSEANAINKGLSALSRVLLALSKGDSHVDFRGNM